MPTRSSTNYIPHGVTLSQNQKSKIEGQGQVGGFLIPQDKVGKLIDNRKYLTKKQKDDIVTALQSGFRRQIVIRPTAQQRGGFLGTLLASIGVPILPKYALTGRGLQNRSSQTCTVQSHGQDSVPKEGDTKLELRFELKSGQEISVEVKSVLRT